MLHKQTVNTTRLAAYERAEIQSILFHVDGPSVKELTLETSIGPLQIVLESYAIALYEPATRKVYRATVTDTREQVPDFHKDFEDDVSRRYWVNDFDSVDGRFCVATSDFEERASAS